VCDKDVRVEDVLKDAKDESKVVKYQALQAPVMHMDSLEPEDTGPAAKSKANSGNKVIASGPGTFRVWEQGSAEMEVVSVSEKAAGPVAKSATAPKKSEWKMTLVSFRSQMHANSQANTANFWEKVQVLSIPWPRHDAPLDLEAILLNELPEGAMYLRCDRLKVLDRPSDGKANKQMEGHGNVYIQGREFHANALSVYHNQQKQQVILAGTKDNPATLTRQVTRGGQKDTVSGVKIIYHRGSGRVEVTGTDQVQGSTVPSPKK
jgi:hypothetical protein